MRAIQAGLPNHVELPESSGRSQSPWRKVLGGPAALARRSTPANQENTFSKLQGNPRTQLHSTYALAYFDHPPVPSRQPASQRPGQRRAGDKRRFSTPTRTRTTWGQDSTVPPWAVLGSKGEIC
ncbi:hypothetical protein PCASD_10847 [Puccinia coronata f. sp. avenae]|uniref:Uncharacterized protein n=1 Tax=Puccinia coronata f. sp. avenae TaxID=200324 RepID=A0A2N5UU63_9BASI|nr:hypothetical protein PCASD_10847 [Puccinia coronata f. sp. avenae]